MSTPDMDGHRTRLRALIDDARAAGAPPDAVAAMLDEAATALRAEAAGRPAATASPPGAAADGAHAPERTAKIGPVTMFTEMAALERAGRHGWRVVGTGSAMHLVAHTDEQWEFRRVFASRRTGRALVADGWQRFSSGWFPWGYYQRPTGRPAEAEQVVGGYVIEP